MYGSGACGTGMYGIVTIELVRMLLVRMLQVCMVVVRVVLVRMVLVCIRRYLKFILSFQILTPIIQTPIPIAAPFKA